MRSSRGTVPRHIPSLLTPAGESDESVCADVRRGALWLLLFGVALVVSLSGCTKKSLSKSELRAITGEIVSSTQKITGHKSEITIRPQADRSIAGVPTQSAADDVYISLSDPSQTGALEDALADIARRHKLRVVATASGGVIRFDFISNGTRTHTVHIVAPIASQPRAPVSHAGGKRKPRDYPRRSRLRSGRCRFAARFAFPAYRIGDSSPSAFERSCGRGLSPRRSGVTALADGIRIAGCKAGKRGTARRYELTAGGVGAGRNARNGAACCWSKQSSGFACNCGFSVDAEN